MRSPRSAARLILSMPADLLRKIDVGIAASGGDDSREDVIINILRDYFASDTPRGDDVVSEALAELEALADSLMLAASREASGYSRVTHPVSHEYIADVISSYVRTLRTNWEFQEYTTEHTSAYNFGSDLHE